MKRLALLAACVLLCLFFAPGARAAGYLTEIPEDRLILANALTGELRHACGDVWLVENERDLAALRGAGLAGYTEPNFELTVEANSWHIDAVHADDAWAHTDSQGAYDRRGTGVTIAVIDSGVEADNDDFNPERILPYRDFGNNQNGVDIWHGTFVAGIIAAQLDNGKGIDGVAPDVNILPVTITSNGVSDAFTAIRAIEYAAARADVINLSIGGGAASSFLERTCRNAVRNGTILVAAAGNYRTDETPSEKTVSYPAGYDCVISVSSCKRSGSSAEFDSLYSYFNSGVNVSAPGSSIRSLYLGGGTAVASGTSFAAPIVSSMAAMAKQVNPAINTEIFLSLLEATSTDLGEPGRDNYYGVGFVNIRAFLDKLDERYVIHYYSGQEEAEFAEPVPGDYSIADGEITLPEPVRKGWQFEGWYEDAELSGRPVTSIPTAATGERSFYARWRELPNEPPALTAAPAEAEASPASLDGLTEAAGFTAELNEWFADPEEEALRFTLVSGPGALEGSVYTYTPETEDAGKEFTVTLRATDGHELSTEHSFLLRVEPLPVSRSILLSGERTAGASELPMEAAAELILYGNRVTAVRLGEEALEWHMQGETLFVTVPALAEGDYEITVEFDAGESAVWRWHVERDYPLLEVRPDAPTEADVSPASLDGLTSATPYRAEVHYWFTVTDVDYSIASGPGTLAGDIYDYRPEAADAGQNYDVTIRAADTHGQIAEHTLTLRVGPLPVSQSVLHAGTQNLALSSMPGEVYAPVSLFGNEVTAVHLESLGLSWLVEDGVLHVVVPDLPEGDYPITVEFSAGAPAVWTWHVYRDYPLLETALDTPAEAAAAPASLDGRTPAVPCAFEIADWFTVTNIDYALVSGPGTLEGSVYSFTPAAEDAGKEYTVTVRAADSHGQSAEHSFTLRVGPLPVSQSVLTVGETELALSALPAEISAPVSLCGNQIAAVRLGGEALTWRLEDETLYVSVPALAEGDYEITVEFDTGAPAAWTWHVVRDYPLLEVRPDAPEAAAAAPASLDGNTPAVPCAFEIADWFTVTGINYTLISGPGTLEGSLYSFTPAAEDAGKEYTITVRAEDTHGQSAEHTLTLRVDPLPVSRSTLNGGAAELILDAMPAEVSVPVSLYGNQITAVRLGGEALTWRLEDEILYASVPALDEGKYEITVEFDAGAHAVWLWQVRRAYPLPEVRPDAPAEATAVPASLDGNTPAVPCTLELANWFTVTGIDYALISGPGTLEGSLYTFTPAAEDAGKEYTVTVRAADSHGKSVEHSFLLHVGSLPVSDSVLTGEFALNLCDPVSEAVAALTLYGNRVAAVRLGEEALTWRVEDETLYASVPTLAEGEYEITVEFDAGAPALWPWRIYRDCPSAVFRDVPQSAWYHSAVDYAVRNGLMNGVGGSRFAPESGFTRAMLVTVLHRAAGSPQATSAHPFVDVAAGQWYSEAVAWAYEAAVVKGVASDRFDPDAPISREQLVTILFRYAGDDGARADLNAFPDAGEVSAYAREAMSWAIARGLINGIARGDTAYLSPRGGATRAQVAAILMRFLR